MKSIIAHMIPQYLGHTLNWVHTQIKYMSDFEHYVITDRIMNRECYPVPLIFAPKKPSDSSKISWWAERLFRRLGWPPIQDYICFSKALKQHRPSCIFAHFGKDGYFALRFKRKLKLPLITRFYGYDIGILPQFPLWRKRYKELFIEGNGFIVEGENMKKLLLNLGCPEEKIFVNHLGIELGRIGYKERKPIKGKYRILVSSTFKEKKGIEYGIRALSLLREKRPDLSISVTIMGDGILKQNLHLLARELDVYNLIEWTGYQPYEEFIRRLYEADVFCAPSVTAANGDTEGGAPVSLIEAGASGLPVVSTTHADIPDVVLDGETGLLTAERDPVAIKDALIKMADNYDKRVYMGQQARKHIESNFDAKIQGEELMNILNHFSHIVNRC